MTSKTTLNAKNLEALSAARLAELLIEISTGNAHHKRRLRMELVGNSSSVELAREVCKRLESCPRKKLDRLAESEGGQSRSGNAAQNHN